MSRPFTPPSCSQEQPQRSADRDSRGLEALGTINWRLTRAPRCFWHTCESRACTAPPALAQQGKKGKASELPACPGDETRQQFHGGQRHQSPPARGTHLRRWRSAASRSLGSPRPWAARRRAPPPPGKPWARAGQDRAGSLRRQRRPRGSAEPPPRRRGGAGGGPAEPGTLRRLRIASAPGKGRARPAASTCSGAPCNPLLVLPGIACCSLKTIHHPRTRPAKRVFRPMGTHNQNLKSPNYTVL